MLVSAEHVYCHVLHVYCHILLVSVLSCWMLVSAEQVAEGLSLGKVLHAFIGDAFVRGLSGAPLLKP